jgi:hypothetical protein
MAGAEDEMGSRLIDAVERALEGETRRRLVDGITATGGRSEWSDRLRTAMARHRFGSGADRVELGTLVNEADARTRRDGFRVLHSWDFRSHTFTNEIVPALILDFVERVWSDGSVEEGVQDEKASVAIALDFYFLSVLTLCAMRAWDGDDPDGVLDRLSSMVQQLQGESGSGHQFVTDSHTLLIYALSQFHPDDHAYDRMIERVSLLRDDHQLAFAKVSAAVLSAHLRWGFWLMYGRDVVKMRDDNVGDYPWLQYTVGTLARAFVDSVEAGEGVADRAEITQSLMQGIAADPWAFTSSTPSSLAACADERLALRGLLERHGLAMLEEMQLQAPGKQRYAPLALHFNFPHNTLVAMVTLALLEGRPQELSLNALFQPAGDEDGSAARESLARDLMLFSRGSPDRLGYRGAMLIAYDPLSGMRSFSLLSKALRATYG